MQKSSLALILLIGVFPILYFAHVEVTAAKSISGDEADSTNVGPVDRYVENVAFGVGEKLRFEINYGFINAGYGTIEVARLIEYEGRPCYQIVTTARSNSFFSTFYKVEDRVESITDAVGIFSWRFEKNLREGSYRSDRMYKFNQRDHYVVYKEDTIQQAPYVHDALSVLFYIRTQELEPGNVFHLDNFVDGTTSVIEVRVHEREQIDVAAGTFDCIVVEPLMQSAGVFKHEGKLKVWLTDDRLHLPVLMKTEVIVGSVTAELTDYELGQIEEF